MSAPIPSSSMQRRPSQSAQDYYAVPQSSPNRRGSRSSSRPPARSTSINSQFQSGRGAIAQGVATGAIGGGYGPYSYNPSSARDNGFMPSRFSVPPSEASSMNGADKPSGVTANSSSIPPYMWDTKDPDLDDALHNPDPVQDAALNSHFTLFSARGWANALTLFLLVFGLVTLFAGYPIIYYYTSGQSTSPGYNLGGINYTGQVPTLPGLPRLIDPETDSSARYRTGSDGNTYELVFSDEFNTEGRTFWPGDDPFWEAVNLHYWSTDDLEWYDPQAVTTQGGKLVITLSERPINNLNFMSGMVTTWNKLCFTTGYLEVSLSLPGSSQAAGLWPGAWTMGNLGRPGYGGTTEGAWPFSYDSCDLGTLPNQTYQNAPAAALTGGLNGGSLSYQPGQRLSACTCPGEDHPGPKRGNGFVGRGVPEIDILEAQIDLSTTPFQGQVSQSFQIAPYNYQYQFNNATPATSINDTSLTALNVYKGALYQQAVSAVTFVDSQNYGGQGYATYGFEYWANPDDRSSGYITWYSQSAQTWKVTSASIGPDSISEVGARLIPEEPMFIILNLGMSPTFQGQDYHALKFPSTMYVDYVRLYQRQDLQYALTCDPPGHPTAAYINAHINAYSNPNITTWAQAGYQFPLNKMTNTCP